MNHDWIKEFPSAITVCDKKGIILAMNDKAKLTFIRFDSDNLIGKNLLDYHNENSCKKINEMLSTHKPNSYTIEKNGIKKIIHQSPWFSKRGFAGLVEISIEIPKDMPHFIRD
jgi:transcriptional regulator with PAS, ATPase and Fis domain